MGNIYVNSVDSAPMSSPVPMGISNVLVVGYDDDNDAIFNSISNPVGAAGLTNRVMRITSWAEFVSAYTSAEIEDTPLKKWVYDYFNEEGGYGVDQAALYLYRFKTTDTGETITDEEALPGASLAEYKTSISPVASVSAVKVSYGGEAAVSQAGGYTAETDAVTGLYTGKITFNSGWPQNALGEYQEIDLALDEVLISYTTGGLESALKVVQNVDAQFVSFAYDNGRMTGSTPAEGIYGGASLIDDYQKIVAFVNQNSTRGYYRMAVFALPPNARPADSGITYGATAKWKDLRNSDLGNNKRIILAAFKQSVGTGDGYLGEFDGSAYMAALIRKCAVREDVGGTKNLMPIEPHEDDSIQYAFKAARMCTIVAVPNMVEGTFLNFGYTLGLEKDRWINHVRCIDQIRHLAEARLLAAIINKQVPYNLEGGYKIMDIISGAVATAQMRRWCEGLADDKPITVPIMAWMTKTGKTPSDWEVINDAANSGIWTDIAFKIKWGPNTERIELAPIQEVAF